MKHPLDLSGLRFGRLTVIRRVGVRKGNSLWECRCDCGNTTVILRHNLLHECSGTRSCGCLARFVGNRTRTHGMTKTSLYKCWQGMKQRCYNPKDNGYRHYGARGIRVCDEWRDSFEAFRDWAQANGYRKGLTIDRIDNNGDYQPHNVRFTTAHEQNRNKGDVRVFTLNGKTQCIMDWCHDYGVPHIRVYQRLRRGWNLEDALTKPPQVQP